MSGGTVLGGSCDSVTTSRSHACHLPLLYKSHAFQLTNQEMGVACRFEHAQFEYKIGTSTVSILSHIPIATPITTPTIINLTLD